QPVRGEDDARRELTRLALADHDDRVRGVAQLEAVVRAERRRVGQGGVAREELVGHVERGEKRVEPGARCVVVGCVGHRVLRLSWSGSTLILTSPPRSGARNPIRRRPSSTTAVWSAGDRGASMVTTRSAAPFAGG